MFEILLSPRAKRLLRFLIGGGINTAFTYGIYLGLMLFLNYQWAFFIAYFIGVIGAYWFNSTIVFHTPLSWKGLFTYPIIYVIQYGLSAILLKVLVDMSGVSSIWAPLWVTAAMLPITFIMNKLVLERVKSREKGGK